MNSEDLDGKQIEWLKLPPNENRKINSVMVGVNGAKSITLSYEYFGEYALVWANVETDKGEKMRFNLKYVEAHAMPKEI